MSELTEHIELARKHRELILKYGYVSGRLEASLGRWPKGQSIGQQFPMDAETPCFAGLVLLARRTPRSVH